MNVLSDLKNRGVKDILISSVDGLSGFEAAIKAAFPKTAMYSSPDKELYKICQLQGQKRVL